MGHPIPGFEVSTRYGARGGWSCDEDQHGEGMHTGDDYTTSGQIGFRVNATLGGTVVIASRDTHNGWGEEYGRHVVIESGDVRHGYCHLEEIVVDVGDEVTEGKRIGRSGNTGKVKGDVGPFEGAHLHYEERNSPFRFCDDSRRPRLSREPGPDATVDVGTVLLSRLQFGQEDSDSVRRLQDVLNGMALTPKLLRVTGNYGRGTRRRVRLWQTQVVGEPAGSEFATGSFPGVRQARKIFEGTGNAVVDDTQ